MFSGGCPPSFVEATCPAVLRIPPRVYERLLEPKRAVERYYKASRKCWDAIKLRQHPGHARGEVTPQMLTTIDSLMQYCATAMQKGDGYPRSRIEELPPTAWDAYPMRIVEAQHFPEWNASRWDDSRAGPRAFPRRQHDCQCTMDDAVGAHLGAAWVPYWSEAYKQPPALPATLAEYVDHCHCDLQTAWQPYAYLFNTSFRNRLIPWSGDTQMALAWLALKWDVFYQAHNYVTPGYEAFTPPPTLRQRYSRHLSPYFYLLPTTVIHGFRAENLPPRGYHDFWWDSSRAGLSSARGVPKMLTEELRRWGLKGTSRQLVGADERDACVRQGWCFFYEFPGFFDDPDGERYLARKLEQAYAAFGRD